VIEFKNTSLFPITKGNKKHNSLITFKRPLDFSPYQRFVGSFTNNFSNYLQKNWQGNYSLPISNYLSHFLSAWQNSSKLGSALAFTKINHFAELLTRIL
jgi:hypothetical protein